MRRREAAARLTSWALAELPINKITATIAADNEASRTILRRTGFRQVGEGRQIFQCRPGAKLPVLYFTMARETQRAAGPPAASLLLVLAGLWEFPGGKMNPGELPEAALVRELKEELGIEIRTADVAPFAFASHGYEGFHLLMPLYLCHRWSGHPAAREGQALAWVAPDRLVEYPMPPADRPLIPMLRDFL